MKLMRMPPQLSSRLFARTVLLPLALAAFHVRSEPILKRYGLTQPMNLTEDQWRAKSHEIGAAGRLRDGTTVPWDFKAAGSVWFEGGDSGLNARNREALARSMDSLLNLKSPYKDVYCTLGLHITGAVSGDSRTREIVKSRVESVQRWFLERGYDPTLILAGAWYGSEPKEVHWELAGGLLPSNLCNLERSRLREDIAKESGNRRFE